MGSIHIRKATNTDVESVQDLIFNIWIHEYGFDVKREDYPDLLDIECAYGEQGSQFFVAEQEGEIIGTIACEELSSGQYVLKRMFVHKRHRKIGIAQKLLDHVLRNLPPSNVYLSTKKNHALAAKAFYLKNGFEITSNTELPSNFPFFHEDDLFMKREIREE